MTERTFTGYTVHLLNWGGSRIGERFILLSDALEYAKSKGFEFTIKDDAGTIIGAGTGVGLRWLYNDRFNDGWAL